MIRARDKFEPFTTHGLLLLFRGIITRHEFNAAALNVLFTVSDGISELVYDEPDGLTRRDLRGVTEIDAKYTPLPSTTEIRGLRSREEG